MKFCPTCENMLYISVTSDNKLKNYCKNCAYTETMDDNTAALVTDTVIGEDVASYKQFMTRNIKYDMTLPRVNNIKCPNNKCPTNESTNKTKADEKEVIYIKYDQTNMFYLYYCCKCEQFWKNE